MRFAGDISMKSRIAAVLSGMTGLLLCGPAGAVSIVSNVSSVPGYLNSLPAEIDFEEGSPDYIAADEASGFIWTGTGQVVSPPSSGTSAVPFGDTSNFYMSVPGGGSETLTIDKVSLDSPGLAQLSLFIGSLDTYNSITFFSGGMSQTISGTDLLDSVIAGNDANSGNRTLDDTNRYFTFVFDSSTPVDAIEFDSKANAFEFDNLTPAVIVGVEVGGIMPEPRAWVVMLTGFALLGLALRQRRRIQAT
jgi:hypothetical protein